MKELKIKHDIKVFGFHPLRRLVGDEEVRKLWVGDTGPVEVPMKEEEVCMHVVVHVFNDASFAKYQHYRACNTQLQLPPLLRGQSWWLHFTPVLANPPSHSTLRPRKMSKTDKNCEVMGGARHVPDAVHGATVCNSQEGGERAALEDVALEDGQGRQDTGCRDVVLFQDFVDLGVLRGQGPLEGSISKFKLLSYTHRTFLFRNLGLALARGLVDLDGYVSVCAPSDKCPFRYMSTKIHVHPHLCLHPHLHLYPYIYMTYNAHTRYTCTDECIYGLVSTDTDTERY